MKLNLVRTLLIITAGSSHTLLAEPDKDPQTLKLLQEARTLIDSKKPAQAIEKCDKVIATYKAAYGSRKEKVYCARTSTESLAYLVMAAADKKSAITLLSLWADAYFAKGYALQDLGRLSEAKASISQALVLSPSSSQYLSELGEIYELEKNWLKALEAFTQAEGDNSMAPEESKAFELGTARRGIGYVLVELGKLDEAEKKYLQCLATDPHDERAARELEYVRQLRNKQRTR